jgi:PAS domain S-box-containing protein
MAGFVLATSMILQFTATALALRLIRITGWRAAWVVIAAAMVLMAGKRSITFYSFLFGDMTRPPDITAGVFALSVSALMLAGMVLLGTFLAAGKRTEEALRENRARLAQAQHLAHLAHWEWRMDEEKLEPSAEMVEVMGRPKEELEVSDEEFLAFIHPDDRARAAAIFGAPDDFSEAYEVQYRIIRPNGEVRVVLEVGESMYDAAGNVVGNFGTLQDITERARAEEALRESESRYREIFEDSPFAIWEEDWSSLKRMIDELAAQGVENWQTYFALHPEQLQKAYDLPEVTGISREALEIFRAPSKDVLIAPTKGRLVTSGELEGSGEVLVSFIAGRFSHEVEARDIRLDGSEVIIRNRATIPPAHRDDWSRVLYAIDDITERKATEAQLRQAQKMEAVGQLTGGVAHDFNNLLAVVYGNLELIEDKLAEDDRLRGYVRKALGAAERGAILTQRLLAFSRKQALRPEAINAGRLVSGMTEMLRRALGETIEIEVVSDSGLWAGSADPAQLENALLNLAINARDAMPEGGKLTIETSNARLDDDYAAAQEDVAPGQYVLLAVTDTGTGMPPDVCARALEPFFTTKDVGKGSGLGLSMVFGFVKQSGGHLSIYSEVGEGTSVKIYLPRVRTTESETVRPETQGDIPLARGETLLVVEDDVEVRTLVVSLLRDLGYGIREAGNAKAALSLLDELPRPNLLLTDVVLPNGMSGRDLVEVVERRLPGTAVLYMSGYSEDSIVHHGRLDEGVLLLQKPFRMADLARAVRRALANHPNRYRRPL